MVLCMKYTLQSEQFLAWAHMGIMKTSVSVAQLFLVHGEYPVQVDFAARLRKKGFPLVEIPELHSTFKLG